jgi:hypothetical protein
MLSKQHTTSLQSLPISPLISQPSTSLRRQSTTQPQNPHATKRTRKTQSPTMRQIQTLAQQLQTDHGHDPTRNRKHAPIHPILQLILALSSPCNLETERRNARAQGLRHAAQQRRPHHGFPARTYGEVQGKCEREALGYVVDEESEEDGEAEGGIGVVSCVGDEAFGNFVEGNGGGGLEADGEEDVGWDVVVVLRAVGVRVGGGRGGGG